MKKKKNSEDLHEFIVQLKNEDINNLRQIGQILEKYHSTVQGIVTNHEI